jgi:2-amino-4-hydroxy-6-hydroxymethyldihydropteridine diphosphokinase
MHSAFVGLGANLGEPEVQLRAALRALDALPGTRLLRQSRLYRSAPWGIEAQPAFVNAVAQLQTSLAPEQLLAGLLAIERAAGRERVERWGPRVLDLDLLLHDELCLQLPGLTLPHRHMHERAFVLVPLAEIAPGLTVPGRGVIGDLLRAVDCAGIKPLG